MRFDKTFWGACASTTLFVLLWGSGAIFARLGLDHASAFAFLTLRFVLALGVLLLVGALARAWLPARGQRLRTAGTGLLMIGGYSICYLLALDQGITPGVLATVLGVQPILTLMLLERRFAALRLAGLAHITITREGERRYALRREAITAAFTDLEAFLHSDSHPSSSE